MLKTQSLFSIGLILLTIWLSISDFIYPQIAFHSIFFLIVVFVFFLTKNWFIILVNKKTTEQSKSKILQDLNAFIVSLPSTVFVAIFTSVVFYNAMNLKEIFLGLAGVWLIALFFTVFTIIAAFEQQLESSTKNVRVQKRKCLHH